MYAFLLQIKDTIKVLVDESSYLTAQDIAGDLQISYQIVVNHIHKIDHVNRLDVWVPHAPRSTDRGPTDASDRERQFVD